MMRAARISQCAKVQPDRRKGTESVAPPVPFTLSSVRSGRARLQKAGTHTIIAEAIDGLAAIDRRSRGCNRVSRAGRWRGFDRLALGQQEPCPTQPLGMGEEGVFRAGRRGHHRRDRALLVRCRGSGRVSRTRRDRRWPDGFRRGLNRHRRGNRHRLGHRRRRHRLIVHNRVSGTTTAHHCSATQSGKQQGDAAHGEQKRIIGPGWLLGHDGLGGSLSHRLRRNDWCSGGWRHGRRRNSRGRLGSRLGHGGRCYRRSGPFHTARRGAARGRRGGGFRFSSGNGCGATLLDRRGCLHDRRARRECRRGWRSGNGRDRRCRRRGGNRHGGSNRRRGDFLRQQRGCTESQNSGDRGPGGANGACVFSHSERRTRDIFNRLQGDSRFRDGRRRISGRLIDMNNGSSSNEPQIYRTILCFV